jgi:legumain
MKINMKLLVILAILSLSYTKFNPFKSNGGTHWAVLVAGSNEYYNYRHQSDVFHSYQILLKNGIPKKNIIVFAYDDIANHSENPFKGQVFNTPDPKGRGVNVYEGVEIDYKGNDVDPNIFLSVLEGDAEKVKGKGTGRVLQSGENDNVFIYFSDHGAPGLIAFPNDELYANDLIETLKKMHENNKYKEVVFYLEACESGSMFDRILHKELNIYATTAADPGESSYAYYCGSEAVVNKKNIGSCLGDEYSVKWMDSTTASTDLKLSLQSQFEHVKAETKGSNVQQYGKLDIAQKEIGQFQGNHEISLIQKVADLIKKIFKGGEYEPSLEVERENSSRVDSRNAKLHYLYNKMVMTAGKDQESAYLQELEYIKKVDTVFNGFGDIFNINATEKYSHINFECLKPSIQNYKNICGSGEYDLKHYRYIAIACQRNVSVEDIKLAFELLCKKD